MKNQWIRFFTGEVFVKLEGKGVERVLNQLIRSNIYIWNVKRAGTETVTFYLSLHDVHNFRRAIRSFNCKVTFLRGQGSPFLVKRSIKNAGFVLGALMFLFIIILLSNMVWGINIKGASPQVEHGIRKELEDIGVAKGKLQFFIPDVETIQQELSYRMNNITWVGVELKGTTFHFQVVEKNEPEELKKTGPQNIVAKKKAIITKMFVEEGQPQVEVNDYVKEGQLLVSGVIGNEDETKDVPAKAKIIGETWYKTSVELPLDSKFEVFSGNEKRKHYLAVGSWKIPIWGFGKHEYKQYVKETEEKNIKFLKWELPVHYIEKTIKEKEEVNRKYSRKEAIKVAKKLAQNNLDSTLPEDAEIISQKVLHEKVENGKVKLNIHYKVIEDIAKGQPIIQGD
ncbi:sporulation protein YqfD [Bacillus seohaeanensis]|uniref:Sporulation protein YqfD n=1 Tax=Bacillus seohaeanensis TaxID=284580 RepID=A0ABW5RNT6_9BACI